MRMPASPAGVEVTLQVRRGVSHEPIELLKIGFPPGIEIEIGRQAIDIDSKHRSVPCYGLA
jgi:hypothetical protein